MTTGFAGRWPALHSARKIWFGAFVGYLLVFGAWAFTAPYDGPPDEVQHVIRAAGAVSGQLAPAPAVIDDWDGKGSNGLGAYQRVPEGLDSPATCWGFDPTVSAACAVPIHGGDVKDVPTSAGRYNPAYYLAVGLPVRLWPSWGGLVLSRLISAALSAAMLAFAFTTLIRWSRHGLLLAGLLVSATPMLAHLAGAVNPNGLEISAGIALFAAGIPMLLDDRPAASKRPLFWLFGVSAVVLSLVRALGPLWVVCAIAALVIGLRRDRIRELWRSRLARGWLLAIGVALLVGGGWTLVMKTGAVVPPEAGDLPHFTLVTATASYIDHWAIYLNGMVGVAGWFDIAMFSPLYFVWIGCAAALIIFGLAAGTWTDRLRYLPLFIGGFAIPGLMSIAEANVLGMNVIGGRYLLPLLVGAPLIAAFILDRTSLLGSRSGVLMKMFIILLLPIHLALLTAAMRRWQAGELAGFNFLIGDWHPPTGTLLPAGLMSVGLLVLAYMFWPGRVAVAGLPEVGESSAASLPESLPERQGTAQSLDA